MKLSELLQKLDTEERPYYGQTEFFEECTGGYYGWAPLEENGFTYRPIKEWNCTDSWVGDIVRSRDTGDGWRPVSKPLWKHVLDQAHPDLTELDHENKRVRLTPEGITVMKYLP